MRRAKSHLWPLKYIDSKQLVYCYEKDTALKVISEYGINLDLLLGGFVDKKDLLSTMQNYSEIETKLLNTAESVLNFNSKLAQQLKTSITPQISAQCCVLNCSNLILQNFSKILKKLTTKNVQQFQIKMLSNVNHLSGRFITSIAQMHGKY